MLKRKTLLMKLRPVVLVSPKKIWHSLILFAVLLMAFPVYSYGQTKVVANEVSNTDLEHVQDPNKATTDDDSFARVSASPGILLGGGAYQGVIELKFPSEIPANQW